jgi:hypothetical protein
MNAGFRAGSAAPAQASSQNSEGDFSMHRHTKLATKSPARFAPRDAGHDMALAATLVFFGVFPILLASSLLLVQALGVLAR